MAKVPIYNGRTGAGTSFGVTNHRQLAIGQPSIGNAAPPQADTTSTCRVAGVYSNILARVNANTLNGDTHVKSWINSADGNQDLTIGTGLTGEFEETTHTDTLVAGDIVSITTAIGGSSGSISLNISGACFSASAAGKTDIFQGGFNNFALAGTTKYSRLSGASPLAASETADIKIRTKLAGTMKFFCASINSNTFTGTTTFGTRVNGANGNLSVDLSGSVVGQIEDTTHSDVLVVDDLLNRYMTSSAGTGTVANGLIETTFETTTDTWWGFTGSVGASDTSYATSVTNYEPFNGQIQGTATEGNVQTKAGVAGTISMTQVYVSANGITADTTVRLRVNGANCANVMTINSGVTGIVSDSTHSDAVVATDELNWQVATGASGTTMAISWISYNFAAAATGTSVYLDRGGCRGMNRGFSLGAAA